MRFDYQFLQWLCHHDSGQPSAHTDTFAAKIVAKTVLENNKKIGIWNKIAILLDFISSLCKLLFKTKFIDSLCRLDIDEPFAYN